MESTQAKRFSRTIQNFTCENCGTEVSGNGYTNHCPSCLHSKHVDVNPGDRASGCLGVMEPISLDKRRGSLMILHQCSCCDHQRWNKVCAEDNMDAVIELSAGC